MKRHGGLRGNRFGKTLLTFCLDAFTFYAVKQDDFSDVPIPDKPAAAGGTLYGGADKSAGGGAVVGAQAQGR